MTGESSNAAKAKAFEEGSKLFYDAFKHLTTVSAGSILLILTFYEKIGALLYRGFAVAALVGFILSIIGSVLAMWFLAKDVSIQGIKTPIDRYFHFGSRITGVIFILSFVCLVIFSAINLLNYTPTQK